MEPVSLPPGFRFHPTDEELVAYYLKSKINGHKIEMEIIAEVDLYKCEPWDLPGKSLLPGKDMEWYFFSPRDRKYPNGSRTNRATKCGYWKATGKDRKVNSQGRAVGVKKTLVYYRGRAPHGCRTNWVMNEYRLNERECEVALGLEDAYALCRVIKKNTVIVPKVGGQYVNIISHANQITRDQSPSIEHCLEGREEDFDSSNYLMSMDNMGNDNSLNINSGTRDLGKWSHFSSEDLLFSLPTSSFANYGAITYPPSKVDIAVECARMQHRFAMPPLEVEEYSQDRISELKMTQASSSMQGSRTETDILQDILSVAHISQELMNQSSYSNLNTWGGNENYAPLEDHFTFNMVGTNYNHINDDMSSMRYVDKTWEDSNTRSIDVSDLDEEFKAERMVENLRWVGMSRKDLEQMEEQKIVPMEDISSFQITREENGMQEFEQYKSCLEQNDTDINKFSLGFINDNDPNENFIEDGPNIDDYSSSPSFEVFEEIKVNHGMFISTSQVAMTFFHQIVPSQTVQVDLNPLMTNNSQYIKAKKTHVMGKLVKSSKKLASLMVFVFALLLMHCVYLEEEMEIWKPNVKEKCCSSAMKRMRQSLVGVISEIGVSVILKKIGIFLTISLALSTIWATL